MNYIVIILFISGRLLSATDLADSLESGRHSTESAKSLPRIPFGRLYRDFCELCQVCQDSARLCQIFPEFGRPFSSAVDKNIFRQTKNTRYRQTIFCQSLADNFFLLQTNFLADKQFLDIFWQSLPKKLSEAESGRVFFLWQTNFFVRNNYWQTFLSDFAKNPSRSR